jgi:hypothetical protein
MADPETLFERIAAARAGRALPPVERWHPAREGASDIAIDVDGRWYYRGSEIRRPEMVKLFSTVLRRDADAFVLVTPAERLTIEVADAPFIAVDLDRRGAGRSQELAFATNVDDIVIADAAHPLVMRGTEASPRPYVRVRGGLDARLSRPVYYRLIDFATESDDGSALGVWSGGAFFELGSTGHMFG